MQRWWAAMRTAFWLAMRDMVHDWRLALVAVMTVIVALAPLVLLFGLKLGVVEALRTRLATDPSNLEIRLVSGAETGLDGAWFDRVGAAPEVGFLAPMTRENGPPLVLINRDDADADAVEVALSPSAAGDPLLERAGLRPPTGEEIILTERDARALRVEPGDTVTSALRRIDGEKRESVNLTLTVIGVLPRQLTERRAILGAQDFLIAVEDFRDWRAVPRYGWAGGPPITDLFVNFRLYARDLDQVEPLVRRLETEENLVVRSEMAAIANVRRIDSDLTLLLGVFIGLSLVGFVAAVALNQFAAVMRKRGSLAVLRLLGHSGAELMLFPIAQAAITALLGTIGALLVFLAAGPIIGVLFADVIERGDSLLRLPASYVAGIAVSSLIAALAASIFAALRARSISPATEFRNA